MESRDNLQLIVNFSGLQGGAGGGRLHLIVILASVGFADAQDSRVKTTLEFNDRGSSWPVPAAGSVRVEHLFVVVALPTVPSSQSAKFFIIRRLVKLHLC